MALQFFTSIHRVCTLSEGLAHSTVHNHLSHLSVKLQSGALIFISELPGVPFFLEKSRLYFHDDSLEIPVFFPTGMPCHACGYAPRPQ